MKVRNAAMLLAVATMLPVGRRLRVEVGDRSIGRLDPPRELRPQSVAPERLFVRVVDRGVESVVLSNPEGWDQSRLEIVSARLEDGTLVQVGKSTEAREDLLGIHSFLYDFDGHAPLNRFGLLGHPQRAHAAFADVLQELVVPDDRAGALVGLRIEGVIPVFIHIEQVARALAGAQQGLHLGAQHRVIATGPVQECHALGAGLNVKSLSEYRFFRQGWLGHGFPQT